MIKRIRYRLFRWLVVTEDVPRINDVLSNLSKEGVLGISDAIELNNIRQHFEKGDGSSICGEEVCRMYSENRSLIKTLVAKTFSKISSDNLSEIYAEVEETLKADFIDAFVCFNTYQRISEESFSRFLEQDSEVFDFVLAYKPLVNRFPECICENFLKYEKHAHWVIDYYFVEEPENKKTYYIPASLSEDKIRKIIDSFLDWDGADYNRVNLIARMKKVQGFSIDVRLRFKAEQRRTIIQQKHLKKGNMVSFRAGCSFVSQQEPKVVKFNGRNWEIYYSKEWIAENKDYATLLNNFIFLFEYTDLSFRSNFVAHPNKAGLTFLLTPQGKGGYKRDFADELNQGLFCSTMKGYCEELYAHGILIEDVFKWFFESYLAEEFDAKGFLYISPTPETSNLEKAILLLTQIDSVLKQFKFYCEDGSVERRLVELESRSPSFSQVPSLNAKKYTYPSRRVKKDAVELHSTQSLLSCIKNGNSSEFSLARLLSTKNLKIQDFYEFNHEELRGLVKRGLLFENEDGFLKPVKEKAYLLREIYEAELIVYPWVPPAVKPVLDDMIASGDFFVKSSLFSTLECKYLDYMFNVSDSVDGPELRNRYVHGSFPLSVQKQEEDYITLLTIMVLIIIKINDEFCCKFPEKRKEVK